MHEADILPAPLVWLLTVFVVLVTLGIFRHHANTRAARKVELRRLQQLLAAENERAEELAEQEYSSMLASTKSSVSSSTSPSQSPCAVCQALTTTRCSRCKSVHYCSSQCQMQHWKQGHKNECTQPKKSKLAVRLAVEPIKKFESKYQTTSDDPHVIASKPPEVEARTLDNVEKRTLDKVETRTLDKVENVTPDGCLVKPKKILFSYNRFVQYFNWDIRRPPCGLINCGNSCFANVILQCLMYTRPLVAYLLEGSHRAECRRNDWCFMCEFQEHARRCFSNQVPFSPFRILSRLRDIGNHLGYGRQEDAHEFMRFAVDSMQSICLDQFGGEKMVDPRTQETTLVQYMFGGHLQSQVKCMQCGHESNRYENMMDLTVEIEGAVESLEDALAQFTAPEWLDGENKYKCDRCNAYVKASKRLAIHEAPNILTIALKRFQSGKFGKINKRVTFPEALNMLPYMSGEGDKPPIYKLYAVVVHVDMLNASFFGHYICYVRDMEGTWYKIDDSKVKEVDTEKVMCQKAYMLMYSRSLARPGPEAAAGSLASSLMDISVSSSSSCNYQYSPSIEKFHGPLHQVSPIIERTLVNGSLINGDDDDTLHEESVGPSYSTLQSTAIERVIDLGFDEPTASDSNTSSTSQDIGGQRCTKRRLENDDVSKPPALCRTRSLSCPPVGRPALTPLDSAHQLADDLPRSFGYSCREDIPFKRQHILEDGACTMDVDSDQEQFVGQEDSNNIGSVVSLSGDLEEAESILENGIPPETLSECRKPPERENRKPSGIEKTVLKPVFARGFLDRQKSSTEYASPTKGYTPFVV